MFIWTLLMILPTRKYSKLVAKLQKIMINQKFTDFVSFSESFWGTFVKSSNISTNIFSSNLHFSKLIFVEEPLSIEYVFWKVAKWGATTARFLCQLKWSQKRSISETFRKRLPIETKNEIFRRTNINQFLLEVTSQVKGKANGNV